MRVKFDTTLAVEFNEFKVIMEQDIKLFIQTQKQKQLIMKVTLKMYLNQFMVPLCQT